jgi:hypothetical protein
MEWLFSIRVLHPSMTPLSATQMFSGLTDLSGLQENQELPVHHFQSIRSFLSSEPLFLVQTLPISTANIKVKEYKQS